MFTVVALISLIAATADAAADKPDVVIFAAASTMNALEGVAGLYEADHNVDIRISTAGTQALAHQIVNGAAADLFLSASPEWAQFVKSAGLVERCVNLLHNQLVIIVPHDGPSNIRSLQDLVSDRVRQIAVGDPQTVPAGIYARQALQKAQLWDQVKHKVASFPNVRQALLFVERGEADAGLVYFTDVRDRQVHIAARVDLELARPAVTLALLSSGAQQAPAVEFFEFLQSEQAMQLFSRHGFIIDAQAGAAPGISTISKVTRVGLFTAAEWSAVRLSLWVACWAVAISLPFGVAIGYWLARRRFAGQWLVETLLNLPLVIPPVVTGYLLLVMFGKQGVIGSWLNRALGIQIVFTWKAAALAAAVVSFPLMVRAIRLAFEAVDTRLIIAARSLGASPLSAFFTVSLPLAKRGVLVGCTLAFARSLGEFGATIMVASNIEGQTRTIPLAIYNAAESSGIHQAWHLVIVSIVLAAAALCISHLLERKP